MLSKIQMKMFERRMASGAGPTVRPGHRGFTLVELMIVMTIMAILMGMVVSVVGAFLDRARDSATRSTISKIQSLLNGRAQALDRQLQRPNYLNNTFEYQVLVNSHNANTTYFLQQMAQVQKAGVPTQTILAKKLLEAKYFPQSASELYDATLYPNLVGTTVIRPEELLYYIATQNVLGDTPIGTDSFNASEAQDKNLNGFPEFIDGWGTPIRFYRWPTRLFRPAGPTGFVLTSTANPKVTFIQPPLTSDLVNVQQVFSVLPTNASTADLGRDPDDPFQRCWFWGGFPNPVSLEQVAAVVPISTTANVSVFFHTPATYHVHLIVSAGADQKFGMYAPDDVTNFGYLGSVQDPVALQDDIITVNIRAGGK